MLRHNEERATSFEFTALSPEFSSCFNNVLEEIHVLKEDRFRSKRQSESVTNRWSRGMQVLTI